MKSFMTVAFACALLLGAPVGAGRVLRQQYAGPAPAPGPAPVPYVDSFQDEIVDQADPEFEKVAKGDDCIDFKDFMNTYDQQMDMHSDGEFGHAYSASDIHTVTKEERLTMRKDAYDDAEKLFKKADKDGDGCVSEKEWSGPPPPAAAPGPAPAAPVPDGAGEQAIENANEADPVDGETEFYLMDANGDKRISRSEAYHYAAEFMDEADINSTKMRKLFEAADTNKDNYLELKEFMKAGAANTGDGKHSLMVNPRSWQKAIRMWSAGGAAKFLKRRAAAAKK